MTTDHGPIDAQTLQRIAKKLDALANDAVHVEHAISGLVQTRTDAIEQSLVCDLQRLDYLSQSLRDIARLVQALSLDSQDRTRLLELVQLASTHELMSDKQAQAIHPPGALDLF